MLNDATTIISNVPGKHLNPLLLAQSQWNDSEGYMMIAYSQSSQVANDSRFYDLLFLRGSHIYECARINSEFRSPVSLDVALRTFQRLGRDESTRVFLFAAPIDSLSRFRTTFHHEPCLKVKTQSLSRKQIKHLLAATGCQKGIIECNEFVDLLPAICLKDILAPEDLLQFNPPLRRGRILVYDTEANKELFGAEDRSGFSQRTNPNDDPSLGLGPNVDRHSDAPPAISPVDEKEAEEFSEFISQFLKSTPPAASARPVADKSTDVNSLEDNPHQQSLFVVTHRDGAPVPGSGGPKPSPSLQGRINRCPRKSSRTRTSSSSPAIHSSPPSPESAEYVRLFERLFHSYRQQVYDVYGNKSESIIADAVRRCQCSMPEFDPQKLSEETAIIILDVIEYVASEAPFLKRPRLRQGALTLVADLYNKQYELLEKNGAIDRVEQFYYQLKK